MPVIKTKRATIIVRLPEAAKRNIRAQADELRRTVNSVIVEAVERFLADAPVVVPRPRPRRRVPARAFKSGRRS